MVILYTTSKVNGRLILLALSLSRERTLMSESNTFSVSTSDFDPEQNAFSVSTSDFDTGYNVEAEKIRSELISHEEEFKNIGFLIIAVAGCLLIGGGCIFFAQSLIFFVEGLPVKVDGEDLIGAGIFTGLAFLVGFVGLRLHQLRAWTRIPLGMFYAIGLFAFPLGTLMSLKGLCMLFSDEGRRVFSPEYAEIIRQTPHVKHQILNHVNIAVGVLLGGLVVIVCVLVMS